MTTKFYTLLFVLSICTSYRGQINSTALSNEINAKRTCGTPVLSQQFETYVQKWINELSISKKTQNINYTIPVVVHVIHNGEAVGTGLNISNAQIVSQITVLNEDFSGSNADSSSIPTIFKPNFAHCGINFCLAVLDTSGNIMPEQGVDRIDRSIGGWIANPYSVGYISDTIKPKTIWNPNKYLNIWCVDIGGGILGYATFPDSATTGLSGLNYNSNDYDGVAFGPSCFGTIGNLSPNYNKGRTATHEIGHWLGLRHIWGDGACLTDYCNDTPPAQQANYGCMLHPHNIGICSGNTDGEMFMDYMDYSNDTCLNMFTEDQKTRMIAILNGSPMRMNLVASNKCDISASIYQINKPIYEFTIFPNPNDGEFIINSELTNIENISVRLYNIMGTEIKHFNNIDGYPFQINLKDLPNGCYTINVSCNGNNMIKKLIIVK